MACKTPTPHLNDVGTVFEIEITECGDPIDISLASAKQVHFIKPDDPIILVKTAVFVTTGADGKIKYIAELGLLNVIGVWKLRGHVESPSGMWSTEWFAFEVKP